MLRIEPFRKQRTEYLQVKVVKCGLLYQMSHNNKAFNNIKYKESHRNNAFGGNCVVRQRVDFLIRLFDSTNFRLRTDSQM